MTYWVVTDWAVTQSATDLCLTALTSTPQHLLLAIQTTYPARTPRWRDRRGRREVCGWLWRWRPLKLIDQDQPGDTTTHTYCFAHTPADPPLWATLSAGNPSIAHTGQLPPIALTPNAPPPPVTTITDTFHRPNSPSLGSTEIPILPYTVWAARALPTIMSQPRIHSLRAEPSIELLVPPTTGRLDYLAYVPITSPNHLSEITTQDLSNTPAQASAGPAIRIIDQDNYLHSYFVHDAALASDRIRIARTTAGITTVIADTAITYTLGDVCTLSAHGPTLRAYHNSTLKLTILEPQGQLATNVGFGGYYSDWIFSRFFAATT